MTRDGRLIPADAVIALPRLTGPHIAGLPNRDGFLPIDAHARVAPHVFAAGDATTEPDQAGRPRHPAGRRRRRGDRGRGGRAGHAAAVLPILRARLFTQEASLELCRDLDAPAHKLAGRHLSGFLAIKEHV